MKDRVSTIQWGSSKEVLVAICAIVFAVCIALPFSAQAGDKLTVKDGSNNTKFVVSVDPTKVGIGTDAPISSLHILELDGTSTTRGAVSSQHYNGASAAVFQYMRSRGTDVAPTALVSGDSIGAFHFQGYDGSQYQYVSSIVSAVNGTVSAGNIPGELRFFTGANSADNFTAPKMVIGTTGIVKVNSLAGSYTNNSAFVCVHNNGEIYASETACP